ncbi:hypothetical protein B5D77_00200 [Microcystis sp. MC19]|nr:hypothetical protein B5D77_00200 [Microcystis sp. MC19]
MRNVNLNILKLLESINNFCLSLANIGLGDSILRVRSRESGVGRLFLSHFIIQVLRFVLCNGRGL